MEMKVVLKSYGLLVALAGVACMAARADVVLYNAAAADGRARLDGGTVAVDGSWDLSDCGEIVFELDVPAQILNDSTLMPVRAVSEAFGCEVNWLDQTQTVVIFSE